MRIILTSKLEDDVNVKVWDGNTYDKKILYAGSSIDCCLPYADNKIFIQPETLCNEIKNPILKILSDVIWGCIYYLFQCFLMGETGTFRSEQKDLYVAVISGDFKDDSILKCVCKSSCSYDDCYHIALENCFEYKIEHKIKIDKGEMRKRLNHWKTEQKIIFLPGVAVLLMCLITGALKKMIILSIVCSIILILMSFKLYRTFRVAEKEYDMLCKQSEKNFFGDICK